MGPDWESLQAQEAQTAQEAQEAQRQKKQRLKLFRNQPLGDKSKIIHVLLEDECGPILIQERVINLGLLKLPKRNGDKFEFGDEFEFVD